ncbi:alpha/beta hydrolase [Spongiactinospora sp. TRM90649]|uniref:alpha/beta hydrolase n=1 Tax=Spongiactinospora sp. TRM90649 TaxID=3031114 RepID=UPI0023F92979|nr:alpha/beta hydrolase [Spongiactinospora sp. TRM90649]MDF5753087.1 alpha/beta hydrolase [Spongiactinospora sp. TRM90649]
MTLDSGFAGFLGMLRSIGAPGSFDGAPDEMRARMTHAIESGWDPAAFAPVASAEDVTAGSLPLKVFRPKADGPVPTVLYFHPGGFTMGSAHLTQDVARRLCHELSAVVVSVDHRLAPEHPFPAAVEDGTAALDWVRSEIGRLGDDPGRIGLAGESSGANLAAVTALLAARGGDPVRALLLASPVTDFTVSYPSMAENATGYFFQAADRDVVGDLYFGGDPETARDPRVSPALAGDLGALPPTVVAVAGFDPLRDDGVVFAARLLQAGVPTTLRVYADLIHPFFGMPAVSPGADRAVTELTALFAAALG